MEWLVRGFSFECSDRYWLALLCQSPEARRYVIECVGQNREANRGPSKQQHSVFVHHQQQRRRRRNRIRPTLSTGDKENDGTTAFEQIRRSLRNPWWNPDDVITFREANAGASETDATPMAPPQSSSSSALHKWVTSLAASRDAGHLKTLRVLLAEAAGRNDLAVPPSAASAATPLGGEHSGAFWTLCYPPLAATIQRIGYRKLRRSEISNKAGSTAVRMANRSGNNSNPRHAFANDSADRRYRTGRFKDRLAWLRKAETSAAGPPHAGSKTEGKTPAVANTAVGIDSHPGRNNRKSGDAKPNQRVPPPRDNESEFISEDDEDKVLALALSVLVGLLQVASSEQLGAWYADRNCLDAGDKAWQKKKKEYQNASPPPCGGLLMVSLVLDLLEELQFDHWLCDDASTNPMSPVRLLSTGVLPIDTKTSRWRKQKNAKKKQSNAANNKRGKDGGNDDEWDFSSPSPATTIPLWYDAAIAVLSQMGRTQDGMRVLRSRTMDNPERSDWMGNAVDVSIRQLHFLALHLDDFRTRHGSILNLEGKPSGGNGGDGDDDVYHNRDDLLLEGDPHGARLLGSVEAWIRLWHQVLLFAQSSPTISFRTLVLDLQDWFTSACAILLDSEEVRQEIKVMIQCQLDELMMDEEDELSQQYTD